MGADRAGLQSKWKAREITFRFVPNIKRKPRQPGMWQRPARLALGGVSAGRGDRADRDGVSLRHGRAKGREKPAD
jgi:hypothetical protein